jgi:tetratricopeptide (TPR) repeat protein
VKIWDAQTGAELHTLPGHNALVNAVAFSPDGARLASASGEQTVKIWDVKTGQEAVTLRGYTSFVWSLAFSTDGTRLAAGCGDGTLRIWDARPWTAAAAAEREAVGLLDFLFTKPLRKADVIDYLRNCKTITPEATNMAMDLVDLYREETSPERYDEASWTVARQPYLNRFQYGFALQQAETACRLAPGHGTYRTTLGAAQYRAGQYKDALGSLRQANQEKAAAAAAVVGNPIALQSLRQVNQLTKGVPADLAFLAMTRHRLGDGEQARAALARLRETVQQPGQQKDEEADELLRQAEALIGAEGRHKK